MTQYLSTKVWRFIKVINRGINLASNIVIMFFKANFLHSKFYFYIIRCVRSWRDEIRYFQLKRYLSSKKSSLLSWKKFFVIFNEYSKRHFHFYVLVWIKLFSLLGHVRLISLESSPTKIYQTFFTWQFWISQYVFSLKLNYFPKLDVSCL